MAITKERLEELIKENAMIYMLSKSRNVDRLQLHKNILSDKNDNFSDDIAIFYLGLGVLRISLEDLYEHEHDAIHAGKYVNMKRVEKLSLPFWSEVVKKSGEWSLIFKRYGCEYLLSFVIDDKDKNWISLLINHKNNKKPKFAVLWSSELTQENYAKACEIVKKIWENK